MPSDVFLFRCVVPEAKSSCIATDTYTCFCAPCAWLLTSLRLTDLPGGDMLERG